MEANAPQGIGSQGGERTITPEHAAGVRREVGRVFAAVVVVTFVEIAVSRAAVARNTVVGALVLLAMLKAWLVGMFFMHLRHETNVLRRTVFWPLLGFGLYGIGLVLDGIWRALR
jgi:caa(3)-type oxidase subunit IV